MKTLDQIADNIKDRLYEATRDHTYYKSVSQEMNEFAEAAEHLARALSYVEQLKENQ